MNQEFRFKNIEKRRNYLLEEIKQQKLMSQKHKKVCATLNYIEYFLMLVFTITGCISICDFSSLLGILIGIMSSVMGLKAYVIDSGIRKYKSITKKNEKEAL